jgi:hypothetical protein
MVYLTIAARYGSMAEDEGEAGEGLQQQAAKVGERTYQCIASVAIELLYQKQQLQPSGTPGVSLPILVVGAAVGRGDSCGV